MKIRDYFSRAMIDTQYPTTEFKDKAKAFFLSFWEELQVRIFQT